MRDIKNLERLELMRNNILKKKHFILIFIFLFFSSLAFAMPYEANTYIPQGHFKEKDKNPLLTKLSNKIKPSKSETITLPKLGNERLILEGNTKKGRKKALQVSIHRDIEISQGGKWQLIKQQDDKYFWRMAVQSSDASFIRAHLLIDEGEKVEIFIYDKEGNSVEQVERHIINYDDGFWSPVVQGDMIIIEIVKIQDSNKPLVKIDKISHGYRDIITGRLSDINLINAKIFKEDSCYKDVNCYKDWDVSKTGVARIYFEKQRSGYLCTGSLLNDQNQSGRAWFLTANHCISDNIVARTLIAYFHYRTDSCNGRVPSLNSLEKTIGSRFIIGSELSDFTLLELSESPPSNVAYLGWSTYDIYSGANVYGIHHPDGSYQRISFGNGYYSSSNYWNVKWFLGSTEGGSSGSPLFDTNKRIVGQLEGGNASCEYMEGEDKYGKFSVSWNLGLKQYLSRTENTKMPVYRFYNTKAGGHFFTISPAERDNVIANYPQFTYEGIGFFGYPQAYSGLTPVYRFYNTKAGGHFFTISPTERDNVIANYPQFTYEGIAFYASSTGGVSLTPVYRFYNTKAGGHFFTIYTSERDYVIANFPYFTFEGIGFYAFGN